MSFNLSDATQFQDWIGRRYIDDRNENVDNKDDHVLLHSELPEGTRVIGSDTMVTMDYRPDRLNVHIDDDCIVTKVRHG